MAKKKKIKDFDFMSEGEAPEYREVTETKVETATSGSPEKEVVESDMRIPPEVIKEARALAGSKKGLEIASFFKKYNISCNLDQLLNGKLDKDGYLA